MPLPKRSKSLEFVVTKLNGSPQYLGTIVATTTKNNHDTASPFTNTGDALKGKVLMVQPDAACYVRCVDANTGTVTTGNGVKLAADEKFVLIPQDDEGWVACVSVSGTTNLKVWELL